MRTYYNGRSVGAARRSAIALMGASLLGGCSLPTLNASDSPVITGSTAESVEVQRPLPPTLAYSDAAKIGQAARAALWQAEAGGAPNDWVNARTGSSGTLTASRSGASAECHPFSTTVTSLGGVHLYSGTLCRDGDARTVLQIEEHSV